MAEPAPSTAADQLAEVERETRYREHRYPTQVNLGRLKPETATKKLADIRAAAATMRTIAAHADGLRQLIQFLRIHQTVAPSETERDLLMQATGVNEVLRTFPDAVLLGTRGAGTFFRAPSGVSAGCGAAPEGETLSHAPDACEHLEAPEQGPDAQWASEGPLKREDAA